ncbi:MAG: chemotaxis protein CheB [Moraxella sp.]|uniref:chemotaxis protein CheB n=1 Tax=Moraxella sp. TaxID=479 RepID=UPI0026DAB8D8|nr:chemotaxis protein CheB [Moraxella sp.]MDO4450527.1 chemotaxis protein CheB [Moraxella sp.]
MNPNNNSQMSVVQQYWHDRFYANKESHADLTPKSEEINPKHIKVIVVSDSRTQRLAFDDGLRDFGFDVIGCFSTQQLDLMVKSKLPKGMVWLVDSPLSEGLQVIIDSHQPRLVLVGFREAPNPQHDEFYQKWQRSLLRRLNDSLGLKFSNKKRTQSPSTPWRYVLFLGASMGGPDAVKEFLDNISPTLPIAILIAHHFDKDMIHGLPKILTRNNQWRCRVVTASQSLQSGLCLVAPIEHQIVCDSEGRVILLDKKWEGEYQPSINQLFKNVSDVYGGELIGIIFSGMGEDGSAHLDQIVHNKSHLWAQSPESSGCPSQPKAVIDSGLCQFIGSPSELAGRITHMLRGFGYRQLSF